MLRKLISKTPHYRATHGIASNARQYRTLCCNASIASLCSMSQGSATPAEKSSTQHCTDGHRQQSKTTLLIAAHSIASKATLYSVLQRSATPAVDRMTPLVNAWHSQLWTLKIISHSRVETYPNRTRLKFDCRAVRTRCRLEGQHATKGWQDPAL